MTVLLDTHALLWFLRDDPQLSTLAKQTITAVESLPRHHKDPFDRILVAQSLLEGVDIVSVDSAFDAYGVNRIG